MEQHIQAVAGLRSLASEACLPETGSMFSVSAKVIGGAKLGRTIGFPTANMALEETVRLLPGIYAVEFIDAFGAAHAGVASFGRRPTVVEDGDLLLETYLLNFSGDLYDQTCTVHFIEFLRPERRFVDLESMVEQIKTDVWHAEVSLARRGLVGRS